MNLCVVSTFDCTVDDFRAMMKEYEEDMRTCVSDWEITMVNDHKVVTMLNVTDMDAVMAIMSSTKMLERDAANKDVDVVYSLEQID